MVPPCPFSASISAIAFGTSLGWSSPSLQHISKQSVFHNVSKETQSWIASMVPLGITVGVLPWSYCNNRFGPRKTMLVQSPLTIMIWIFMAFLRTIDTYKAGRFFCGFFAISYMVCGECLLIDSVHRENLRHLLVFFRSSVGIGVFLSYLIGFFWSESITCMMCTAFPALHTLLLLIIPESPVYLYGKNVRKSENSLVWYRGDTNINTEMRKIKHDLELRKVDPAASSAMLYAEVVTKGIRIVIGLLFFQALTGYYIFLFYAVRVWHVHKDRSNPKLESLAYAFFCYFSNFIGVLIHYRLPFGVRKPIIISTFLVAFQLTVISIYLYLHFLKIRFVFHNWIPFIAVLAFVFFYEMGLSTLPAIILHEYMPYQVYYKAKPITMVAYWFFVFLVVKYYISVRWATHGCVAFGILAAITYMGVLYMYFFVVETKDKSLVQVQLEIGGNPIGSRGRYTEKTDYLM